MRTYTMPEARAIAHVRINTTIASQGDTGPVQLIAGWHRKSQANDLPSRSRYLQCEADGRYRTDIWTRTYDYENW